MRTVTRCVLPFVLAIVSAPLFGAQCFWVTSPTAISFGTYSVFSTNPLATANSFDFRCNPNMYGKLTLSTGGSGVFVPSRLMSSTAQYNIYLDAGGTQIWGDTSGGSVDYIAVNSTPQNKDFAGSMYGITPAGQDLAVGTYTDTVIATLSYSQNPTGPWTNQPGVSIPVTMNIIAECRVDSFNMNFGTYNPFSTTALTQSTLLKVYCTKNSAPASVVLNNGANASGGQKRMTDGLGNFLNYNAAMGSTAGTSTSSLVPINAGFALNGNVPAQQDVAVGNYLDTLVATVNY